MKCNVETIRCFIKELLYNDVINQSKIERKYDISHVTVRKFFKILKKAGYIKYRKVGKYKYIRKTEKFRRHMKEFKFIMKFLEDIDK